MNGGAVSGETVDAMDMVAGRPAPMAEDGPIAARDDRFRGSLAAIDGEDQLVRCHPSPPASRFPFVVPVSLTASAMACVTGNVR